MCTFRKLTQLLRRTYTLGPLGSPELFSIVESLGKLLKFDKSMFGDWR